MATGKDDDCRCILVVDDDERIVRFVTSMLVQRGYTVIPAVGPERAIDIFEHAPMTVDLLLSDVIMPGMRGPELAQHLRKNRPDLPVVFMTGYADAISDQATILEKPFGMTELHRTIARALQESAGNGRLPH